MNETSMARRFADAVNRSERTGDAEPIVALFDADAELRSLVHEQPLRGIEGARKFWREYLGSFRQLRSRFEHMRDDGELAVLEWVTEGTLASGDPIVYSGASIVEYAGGRVTRFRTYYDPTPLSGRHAHVASRVATQR